MATANASRALPSARAAARLALPPRSASRLPMAARSPGFSLLSAGPSMSPAAQQARVSSAVRLLSYSSTRSAKTPADAATADDAAGPGVPDAPATPPVPGETVDWSSSFHGLSTEPFSPEIAAKLMAPLEPADVEIKPDGILYLPEIKYRRILNGAFGPGGWGLAPRGELKVGEKVVSREFALVVQGRFVAAARGECNYFGDDSVATAGEGSKSNALMRCCKDIGVASELWDPRFIREFKQSHCREVWVEHVVTKKRRQIWLRKDTPPVYPYVLPTGAAKPTTTTTTRTTSVRAGQ